eukprot:Tbor_TRINITY_DN6573_c0_g1::TRINITY_DN6573_c0_g1_i1::g.7452::m.7452
MYRAPGQTPEAAAAATTATYPLRPSDYIRCISKEGDEFIIPIECTKGSRILSLHLNTQPMNGVSVPPVSELIVNKRDLSVSPTLEDIQTLHNTKPFELPKDVKWDEYISNPEVTDSEIQEAIRSITLHPFIAPEFVEPVMTTVRFPHTPSTLLEVVIQYLFYYYRYEKEPEGRPEFQISPQDALGLIKIATMLEC